MGRIRAAETAARHSRAGTRRNRRSGGVGFVEIEAEQVLHGCHADRGAH